MRRTIWWSAAAAAALVLVASVRADDPPDVGAWTAKAPMPTARHVPAIGVIDGKLYAAGGWNGSSTTANEMYDPATNTWSTRAPTPASNAGAGAGVIDGKLYVAGGSLNGDGNQTTNRLDVYDPALNAWVDKAPMPTARRDMAAAGVIGGRLYVAGGTLPGSAGGRSDALEMYDPATDTWTTRAPMPTPRQLAAAGVIDGLFYVAGGSTSVPVTTVEAYDPATNTWTTKAPMPTARWACASGVIDGVLYVVGGADGSGAILDTVEAYDPATNTWSTVAPMPTARWVLSAGVVDGALYALGGNTASGATVATNEAFTPPAPSRVEPPAGPVAWWPLDGDARDVVSGIEGVGRGWTSGSESDWGGTPTFEPGRVGRALRADLGYLEVAHRSALAVSHGDFTLELWLWYGGSGTGGPPLVGKARDAGGLNNADGWGLYWVGPRLTFGLGSSVMRGECTPDYGWYGTCAYPVPERRWTHVAAVKRGTPSSGGFDASVYFDGVRVDTVHYDTFVDTDTADLRIGGSQNWPFEPQDEARLIDEVALYDRALSDAEIRTRFEAGRAGTIETVAGGGSGSDGAPATVASLARPYDVAADAEGNLFVADTWNNRIRRVDAGTGVIEAFAGNGSYGTAGDGGLATAASLGGPNGIAVDAAGNVFIADTSNNRVRRVDALTRVITTVASFSGPEGVAVDAAGNLLVADTQGQRIRRVDAATGVVTTVAGNGTYGASGDGGPATAASLGYPSKVAVDAAGNVFIADVANYLIRRVDRATGIIQRFAGSGFNQFSGDGGPATTAGINATYGLAFDAAGNLFLTDTNSHRVRRIDAVTGIITTVAGNGSATFSGDGGPATDAGLDFPFGVTFDAAGNLYVADTYNDRIRRVYAAGVARGSADVALMHAASPDPVDAGEDVTFTATVTNAGPDAATGLTVYGTVPPTLSIVSCTSTSGGVVEGTDGARTVRFPSLAPGAAATITLVATVDPTAAAETVNSFTWTAVAGSSDPVPSNNTATASVVVAVGDVEAPVVHIDEPMDGEVFGPGEASVAVIVHVDDVSATRVVSSPPGIDREVPAGGRIVEGVVQIAEGPSDITLTATDDFGNVRSETVRVVLDLAPVLAGVPSDITAEATSAAGAVVDFTPPAAGDFIDGALPVTCSPSSGTVFALRKTTVECAATDSHGNTATASFFVTVQDTTPPALTLPADITLEATGPAGAVATFTATATDIVDGVVLATCSPTSGSTFALGVTAVECSASDAAGNTGGGSFTVTVEDTTAPTFTAPADVTVVTSSASGAAIDFATPVATDAVDPAPTVTCAPPSGSTFPVGTTTVICSASDASGNTWSATFAVTVQTLSQASTAVASVVQTAGLPAGVEGELTATLDAATAAFDRGNATAGANQLRAFQNKVEAQTGKSIDVETAAALVAAAQTVIDAAGR